MFPRVPLGAPPPQTRDTIQGEPLGTAARIAEQKPPISAVAGFPHEKIICLELITFKVESSRASSLHFVALFL